MDLNNSSPQAHVKLEFDVLGVAGNLLKYVVHLSKIGKKIKFFLLLQGAQTKNDQFLASRNFRG